MKTLTWQKPGQQNVAQELIKIIINYVAELRFISIIRKEVFTSINIRRIRWGVYPPIAYHLVKYFLNWSETRDAMAQLTIPGYTIQPASPFEFSWIGILLLILLTEVFVVAVKLKQENDLTI